MSKLRVIAAVGAGLFLFNILAASAKEDSSATVPDTASASTNLHEAADLLKAGQPRRALSEHIDKVIASYELAHKDTKKRVYNARTQEEMLYYLITATKSAEKEGAVVEDSLWSAALYMRAYALIDLGQPDEAKKSLLKALEIEPQNAQYLGELGHIYQEEKDWPNALGTFEKAATAAETFSPDKRKTAELTRAWRGMGYVLTEQGKLDEAAKQYKKCLKLNKNDRIAKGELEYIKGLKAKRR